MANLTVSSLVDGFMQATTNSTAQVAIGVAASGKTFKANNSLTLAGTDSTTMTFPGASASIGYLGVPQNSNSAAYTTVLADAVSHLPSASDNNPRMRLVQTPMHCPTRSGRFWNS